MRCNTCFLNRCGSLTLAITNVLAEMRKAMGEQQAKAIRQIFERLQGVHTVLGKFRYRRREHQKHTDVPSETRIESGERRSTKSGPAPSPNKQHAEYGKDIELTMLGHARDVVASAEQLVRFEKHLATVSREVARSARTDVEEAITWLLAFSSSLTRRIDE
jgi:hypothetical protein